MPLMEAVVLVVLAASALWVYTDAKSLGVRKGSLGGGFLDEGPVAWALGVLLIWVVVFPLYLGTRPKYVKLNQADERN